MMTIKTNTGLKTTWSEQKAKLKSRFPKLTDADLNFEESRKDEMFRGLEIKLAIRPEDLQKIANTK